MKITEISYGRTFNLGNYEVSRIDMTAEVLEGEDHSEAMAKLKKQVDNSGSPDVVAAPSVPLADNDFPLRNYEGVLLNIYTTANDWLNAYREGSSKTNDIVGWATHNNLAFDRVKTLAEEKENPRALQIVNDVEAHIYAQCRSKVQTNAG